MSDFKFISLEQFPEDEYTQAIATVAVRGIVLSYSLKKKKDGTGSFWAAGSINLKKDGEKVFKKTHMLDSRAEDDALMEFIKDNAKAFSVRKPLAPMKTQVEDDLPF